MAKRGRPGHLGDTQEKLKVLVVKSIPETVYVRFLANCVIRSTSMSAVITQLVRRFVECKGDIPEFKRYMKGYPLIPHDNRYRENLAVSPGRDMQIARFPSSLHYAMAKVCQEKKLNMSNVVRWMFQIYNVHVKKEMQ